jgi:hypothetical protein
MRLVGALGAGVHGRAVYHLSLATKAIRQVKRKEYRGERCRGD